MRPLHFITMLQLLHWFLKIPPPGGDSGQWHPGWGSTSTFNAVVFPFCFIMFWPDKSLLVASCPLLGIPSPFLGQPANHQNSRALRKRRNRPFHLTEREGQGRVNHQWGGAVSFGMFFGGDGSFSLVSPYMSAWKVWATWCYMYIWWSEVARIGLEPEWVK